MLREANVRLADGRSVGEVCRALSISARRACKVISQPRPAQRRVLVQRDDETALTQAILDLATEYGRYRYHRIIALLRDQG
jgi:hypothetical protein